MSNPRDKITVLVDNENEYIGATVEQIGSKGVLLAKLSNDSGDLGGDNPLPVSLSEFNTNDIEEASSTVTYIGMETQDGEWMIQKIDTSSDTSFGYATVTNNATKTSYTLAWTGRVTLTYQNYSDAK